MKGVYSKTFYFSLLTSIFLSCRWHNYGCVSSGVAVAVGKEMTVAGIVAVSVTSTTGVSVSVGVAVGTSGVNVAVASSVAVAVAVFVAVGERVSEGVAVEVEVGKKVAVGTTSVTNCGGVGRRVGVSGASVAVALEVGLGGKEVSVA